MPRQPLATFYKNDKKPSWCVGPKILNFRPELASIIGRCIGLWASVEHQLATTLGVLLKVPDSTDATFSVFMTLQSAAAQRNALEAAAKSSLSPEHLEIFQAILNIHRSVAAERSALAHGQFGISDDLPNDLLWIDSKHYAYFNVSMLNSEPEKTNIDHSWLTQKVFVYTKNDLEAVYNEIDMLWNLLFDFLGVIRPLSCPEPSLREELYNQLISSPRIQQELSRMKGEKSIS